MQKSRHTKAKQQLIEEILKNPTYYPTSGMYKHVAAALETLSREKLEQLEIIVRLGRDA